MLDKTDFDTLEIRLHFRKVATRLVQSFHPINPEYSMMAIRALY